MFRKIVLRRIFGHRREEVNGEQRKLQNGKLHNMCFSSDAIIHDAKAKSDTIHRAYTTHERVRYHDILTSCTQTSRI
jgi:hypothetical protein